MIDFIRLATDGEIVKYMYGRVIRYPLPTEVVIQDSCIVRPDYGRVYSTGLYILDGDIVDYKAISETDGFTGSSSFKSVYMAELYDDQGCDGHVKYLMDKIAIIAIDSESEITWNCLNGWWNHKGWTHDKFRRY